MIKRPSSEILEGHRTTQPFRMRGGRYDGLISALPFGPSGRGSCPSRDRDSPQGRSSGLGSPSRVRLPACTRSGMLNAGLPLTAAVPRGLLTRFPILPASPSAGGGPGHPWALCPPHCNGLERACQSIWGRDAEKGSKSAAWDVFKGGGRKLGCGFPPSEVF